MTRKKNLIGHAENFDSEKFFRKSDSGNFCFSDYVGIGFRIPVQVSIEESI